MDQEIQVQSNETRSGFCKSSSIFYSIRDPIPLPTNHSLNVTTFISSLPHHGKVAFIDAISGDHLTFSDLWNAVDSVSSSLFDLGVRKGHVILLISPNSIFFPVVCLSVMYLGAVITTANPLNTEQEISKQISISNPFLVFTIPRLLSKFSGSNGVVIPVVLMGGANFCSNPPTVCQGVKVVGVLQEMMTNKPCRYPSHREKVTLDDTATLLFSSGTTGESKGVVSTHRNIITMIQLNIGRFRTHEKDQVYLAMIPMFHTFGMATFVLGLLSRGCPVVVLPRFDMDDMLTAVQKHRITYLPLAPPVLVALINNADVIKKKYNVQTWRYVLSGGAPLSKELTEEFEKKFPQVAIFQGYALTESNGAGAGTETWEESRRFGSIGLLTASTEAKIVDPDTGEALPENRSGELWLRGPSIMKGYLKNEEATAATLVSDGWLRTGDICYIDDDGFLFIVDRLKDLIKYNGYQVAPAELEALLLTHPHIIDAAVIPFPDKRVGQYPMAYVVRKPGSSLSGKDVIDFISKQVAPYKKIRGVAFINSIPKNPSGKILRKNLILLATSKV